MSHSCQRASVISPEGNTSNDTQRGRVASLRGKVVAAQRRSRCHIPFLPGLRNVHSLTFVQSKLSQALSSSFTPANLSWHLTQPRQGISLPWKQSSPPPPPPQISSSPPLLLSVFLIFLFTSSLPIYPFPITSLRGLLLSARLHLSLSNYIPLLFYLAQSFLPLSFLLHPHVLAGYIMPLLMRICEETLWLAIEE